MRSLGNLIRETFTGERPIDVPLEQIRHFTLVGTHRLDNGLTAHPGREAVEQPHLPPWDVRHGDEKLAKVIPISRAVRVEADSAPGEVMSGEEQVTDAQVLAYRARSGEVAMGTTVNAPAIPAAPGSAMPPNPEARLAS